MYRCTRGVVPPSPLEICPPVEFTAGGQTKATNGTGNGEDWKSGGLGLTGCYVATTIEA